MLSDELEKRLLTLQYRINSGNFKIMPFSFMHFNVKSSLTEEWALSAKTIWCDGDAGEEFEIKLND